MIGVIQVFFLVLVILVLVWCVFLLVSIHRMDKNRCACGRFNLVGYSYTQHNYDDAPVYVHEKHRCYPYLEELV